MRVTEKLLLGIACSALCLSLTGCSDDDDWSPTSNLSKEYNIGAVDSSDSAIVLISNGQSETGFSDQVYVTSTALPTKETNAKITDDENSADPHGLTHRLLENMRENLKDHAVRAKVLGKESFTPNTVYTKAEKYDDVQAYVSGMNDTGTLTTFRKMLANDETESVLVFAEVDPDTDLPCIEESKALEIDKYFGKNNPYDDEGIGIGERVRSTFGHEWNADGGRDGESKVIIMLCRTETISRNLYGYFHPQDAFSKKYYPQSNEGEILYLNAGCADEDIYSTAAHEFQHMCDFNQKVCLDGEFTGESENVTINEGKSTLSEDICGFKMRRANDETELTSNAYLFQISQAYLGDPGKYSLNYFNNTMGEYGHAYLLTRYIADRYGIEKIHDMATSNDTGFDNIEKVTKVPFEELYYNFGMANLLSNLNNTPSKYNYKNIDLSATYLNGTEEAVIGRAVPVVATKKSNEYDIKSMSNNYYSFKYPSHEENVTIGLVAPSTSVYSLSFFRNGVLENIF
ncbi:MAG: hypothetical protein ACI38Q_01635 [Candidatus Bruticola sp.]